MSLLPYVGQEQHFLYDHQNNLYVVQTQFVDGTQAVEQFTSNNICIMRRFKTVDIVGRQSIWQVEIGESPQDEQKLQNKICDQMFISSDQPHIVRLDSPDYFIFRISNVQCNIDNFQINCDDDNIIIKTNDKTFYKKLQITDMQWQKLKLDNRFLQYFMKDKNQLIIIYIKPVIIKELEKAAQNKRKENC